MARITEALELSTADIQVLTAILDYQDEHGRAPMLRHLMRDVFSYPPGQLEYMGEMRLISVIHEDPPSFVIVTELGKLALLEHQYKTT